MVQHALTQMGSRIKRQINIAASRIAQSQNRIAQPQTEAFENFRTKDRTVEIEALTLDSPSSNAEPHLTLVGRSSNLCYSTVLEDIQRRYGRASITFHATATITRTCLVD